MATQQHPPFIKVGGYLYRLETAGESPQEYPGDGENPKGAIKDIESYLAGKENKLDSKKKETKLTEKALRLPPTSEKGLTENMGDKFVSPDRSVPGSGKKEPKQSPEKLQLKQDSEKELSENIPQKSPAKVKVLGQIYELVDQPEIIKVEGRTFVKLPEQEAQVVLKRHAARKAATQRPFR